MKRNIMKTLNGDLRLNWDHSKVYEFVYIYVVEYTKEN